MDPKQVLTQYNPGEIVIHEGETDGKIYIHRSGTLEVVKQGVVINEIDEPGAIVGEMSNLLEGKRTVTIRAKTRCELYRLDHQLSEILEKFPNITIKILVSLADRLVKLEEQYLRISEENERMRGELNRYKSGGST